MRPKTVTVTPGSKRCAQRTRIAKLGSSDDRDCCVPPARAVGSVGWAGGFAHHDRNHHKRSIQVEWWTGPGPRDRV
eukprot:4839393-Prymnesium_polylepis.1